MFNRRLLAEAGTVNWYLALAVGMGLVTGMLVVLQASYLARTVSLVFLEGEGLAGVWPWLLALLAVILVRGGVAWLGESAAHSAAARIKHALRQQLLSHLYALGPVHLRRERTGEMVNLLVEGVEAMEAYFSRYLPQLALAAMVPLMILGFVFPLDLMTGIILLFTAPLIPLFMLLIGRRAETLSQQQWESLSRMSAHFLDVLQGLTTLKIFGRSKAQAQAIARVSDRFRDTTLGVLRVAFLSALALELLVTVSTAVVAVALGLRLVYGRIPFEQAFFLLLLAPEFYGPLRLLGSQFHAGLAGVTAATSLFAALDTPAPSGPVLPPSAALRSTSSCSQDEPGQQPTVRGLRVVFRDVHCAYDGGTRPALQGVSFSLNPGETVALVGASGAGKSTVINLLLGFIQPDQGSIMVNGVPLAQLSPQEWYRQLTLVPQHPYLFSGTIMDNICLGRPQATLDQVVAAAQLAGAHDFIASLPGGYDTQVGQGGLVLSGGQAQRLAIARAFLMDTPLVILDEATAGLDWESEQVVQEALARLRRGRTVLVIAHRLNTVKTADRILVLDAGRVVETGSHEELLDRRGSYYRLVAASGGGL